MPSPNDFKDLIVSATGDLCEKLNKLFSLPQKFWEWYSGFYTESNAFSEATKTKICAVITTYCTGTGSGGSGGGTDNPAMPFPRDVNATDGTYDDKVLITWSAVTPPVGAVTAYKIYRVATPIDDPNNGSVILLATVAAPTLSYEDTSAVLGTIYNYWVTATDGVNTSAFSDYNNGSKGAPTITLTAISDLRCTKGFNTGRIGLVFTPPTGATHFDIYRNTLDDSGTATKIASAVAPFDPAASLGLGTEIFFDNDGEMLYLDAPPIDTTEYYYWVIGRKSSPPAVSPFSNSSLGWDSVGHGVYSVSSEYLARGGSTVIGAGITKMYAVVTGGGGGGAGGGSVYGGGGGGGGGRVIEEFTVVPGDVVSLVASPNTDNTGNAASATAGVDGSDMLLKINGVTKITAEGGNGGAYSASGAGAGGTLGSGSGTTSPTIYNGHAGKPGAAGNGGATGYFFGGHRARGAWNDGFTAGHESNGSVASVPGGGSHNNSSNTALAVGGYGLAGSAVLGYGL